MAKNYLDKTGLSYFFSKIKGLIPTKISQLTNDSKFVEITDSGYTDEGYYYEKRSDGQMEIRMTIEGSIDIATTWDDAYISDSIRLPNYPVSFIERPNVQITGQPKTGTQFTLAGNGNQDYGDVAHGGSVALSRPNKRSGVEYVLYVTAKGRWKE